LNCLRNGEEKGYTTKCTYATGRKVWGSALEGRKKEGFPNAQRGKRGRLTYFVHSEGKERDVFRDWAGKRVTQKRERGREPSGRGKEKAVQLFRFARRKKGGGGGGGRDRRVQRKEKGKIAPHCYRG